MALGCFAAPGQTRQTILEYPLLLRNPTANLREIAFSFAGDIWIVPKGGGTARNLTHGAGVATMPVFSPDGSQLAFTMEVNSNLDVYVLGADRANPRRLTFHPGADTVLGWSPDSQNVLFRSPRSSYSFKFQRLYTVPALGGAAIDLPLAMGYEAAFSPDGKRLAYVPMETKNGVFKRYRGGRTTPIWIARLSDSSVQEIPHGNYTDFNPIWIGETIYFLSDRSGPVTLFAYNTRGGTVTKCFDNTGFDLKSASYGGGVIVYEQFGTIGLFDIAAQKTSKIAVQVEGEFREIARRNVPIQSSAQVARLASSGDVALQARGDIIVYHAAAGTSKNLTSSSGVMEREPVWSPDASRLAYFSDESGEYALHVRAASGEGRVEKITLGRSPTFYDSPRWSPDGSKIAFRDKNLNLWVIDLVERRPLLISASCHEAYSWSPDSRKLTYSRRGANRLWSVYVYDFRTARSVRVTDSTADTISPVFSADGDRIYFLGTTVLRGTGQSGQAASSQRRLFECLAVEGAIPKALPGASRPFSQIMAVERGSIFLSEKVSGSIFDRPTFRLVEYSMESGKATTLAENVTYADSAAGQAIYRSNGRWFVLKFGDNSTQAKQLQLDGQYVEVDPKAQWSQMYDETWRIVRDYFHDPRLNGLNWTAMRERYRPFLKGIVAYDDLRYLFGEMLGELSASHVSIDYGGAPRQPRVPVGLLGADLGIDSGRYRFNKIYAGDPWDASLRAPLAQAGVMPGDYLIAIQGNEVRSSEDMFARLEGLAGKPVSLRVAKDAEGKDSREVRVQPTFDETALRQYDWIEANRRLVAERTHGQVAYLYVGDTLGGGYERFLRQFYSQSDKKAAIIDIRFNLGGGLPDEFMSRLSQRELNLEVSRESGPSVYPPGIYGPKVLLINEYAGSGGDVFAWYFRILGLGKIVGKRTWGGVIGAFNSPELMDGTVVEVPNIGNHDLLERGEVENYGVPPDTEVNLDPAASRVGRDSQLEAAILKIISKVNGPAAPGGARNLRP
jgi:tricorn protease